MARNRAGQYALSLRRDLLADYYDETMDSTCFIQKGWVDSSNPLIFNPEGVTVNKIQEHEILLRDSTRAAWIVGYVAPNLAKGEDKVEEFPVELTYPQEIVPDISTFEYDEYIGKTLNGLVNKDKSYFFIWGQNREGYASLENVHRYFNGKGAAGRGTGDIMLTGTMEVTNLTGLQLADLPLNINYNVFNTLITDNLGNEDYFKLQELRGRIYNDNGVYKELVITESENEQNRYWMPTTQDYPNILQEVKAALTAAGAQVKSSSTVLPVFLTYSSFTISWKIVSNPFTTGKIVFKSTNRQLYDAPYKMFCIPVTAGEAVVKVGETLISTTKDKMLQIASSIATGLGSNLYDIQLLPYCPIEGQFEVMLNSQNGIEYLGGTADIDYSVMTDDEEVIGYIF